MSRVMLQVLSLLTPLRQACSGGQPSRSGLSGPDEEPMPFAERPVVPRDSCTICLDLLDRPVVTPCQHVYCRPCIVTVLTTSFDDERGPCPLCRREIKLGSLVPARFADEDDGATAGAADMMSTDAAFSTFFRAKLEALLTDLAALRARDPTAKVLVFSQFQSSLNWLKEQLTAAGLAFRTLEGSMTRAQRTRALEEFQNDPPTTIFLLSVRAGAVGINLTQASHVYLLEPCLNPALEHQAVGRVHRMGQTRQVTVTRLVMEDSIEEKFLEFRKNGAPQLAGPSSDVSGDKAMLKYEEFVQLFS
jgi:SNF2 family DNA or RNA helicase